MPRTVRHFMVSDVLTVASTATVAEASRLLSERQVSGAPVVDEGGRPVGVLSRTDLARGWEQAEEERRRIFYQAAAEVPGATAKAVPADFAARAVSEVMMPLLFSVQQDDSLRKAAALMSAEGIHRVIVLDGQRIVGLLSASDVVAAVGRGELVEAP